MTHPTWDAAARNVILREFEPMEPNPIALSEGLIDRKVEMLRTLVRDGHFADHVLGAPIRTIGVAAAEILEVKGLWNGPDFLDLLCRKQHDYGHANILSFRMVGVAVRVSDKVARYVNLKGKDGVAEPAVDSLLDMVGYGVIAQMLMDGTFELDLDPTLFEVAA